LHRPSESALAARTQGTETALARAIEELPERERHILALYYQEELTLAKIGEVSACVNRASASFVRSPSRGCGPACVRRWPAGGTSVSKILSQDEIDALLALIGRGDDEREAIETADRVGRRGFIYNFRRPDRVSKEQVALPALPARPVSH